MVIGVNRASQPNVDVGASQYTSQLQGAKVVLPNHSAVLGEANQNLPSDAQHQGNFCWLTFSADQTALSSQNILLPYNGMEPQPGSVMT